MKKTTFFATSLAVTLLLGEIIFPGGARTAAAPQQSNHNATRADFETYMKDLSNWGRWGKDDQMGAVNLITPAKRKQALASVKEGISISLAHSGELEPAIDNPQPIGRGPHARATFRRNRRYGGHVLHFVPRLHPHAHGFAVPLSLHGQNV